MENTATPRTERRKARLMNAIRHRQKTLRLIVANVHDPHNVSAILRSCDAFGVGEIDLYYTDTAFPNMGKKSSASARKWVNQVRHTDASEMIGGLRSQDYQILTTGFSEKAKSILEWDLTKPTAIILGNEHRGVDPELDALAPDQIYIPMHGMVQSLNVSVAAAVTLYEAFRQRKAAGMFDEPTFSAEEVDAMFEEWCRK